MHALSKTRRLAAGALAMVLVFGACGGTEDDERVVPGGIPAQPQAGTWKPWVLTSSDQIKVPAPPKVGSDVAKAELEELKDLAANRTPQMEAEAHRWSDYPSLEPWVKENMELVSEQSKNPPLASRGYGLVSVAM